nr:ribonuclease H-like domain-containing protein [Tanacetum cinerariifolium]
MDIHIEDSFNDKPKTCFGNKETQEENKPFILKVRLALVGAGVDHWSGLLELDAEAYEFLSRYKARLVANGRIQQLDIDCDDTFSPVVKPATILTYAEELLKRAHIKNYNPRRTPVDTYCKLDPDGDIMCAFICMILGSRISLLLSVFFGMFEREATLSRSSVEAEYRGVANVVAETPWLRNLLWNIINNKGESIFKRFRKYLIGESSETNAESPSHAAYPSTGPTVSMGNVSLASIPQRAFPSDKSLGKEPTGGGDTWEDSMKAYEVYPSDQDRAGCWADPRIDSKASAYIDTITNKWNHIEVSGY